MTSSPSTKSDASACDFKVTFKIDGALLASTLSEVPSRAKHLEEVGFDGTFTFEGPHEPFLPLALAAEHSSLELDSSTCGTSSSELQ